MPASFFPDHTLESAPPAARRGLQTVVDHLGYLPAAVARLAASPEALAGFQRLSGLFEQSSLDPVAREVLVLTVATRNGCHFCVAMHSARLAALDPPGAQDLLAALRAQRPLPDRRWETLRRFVLGAMDTAGAVPDPDLAAFVEAGFTARQALDVVLGIATYTLSTLANRMTGAPLDDPRLEPYAWSGPAA